jgi:hypothetical protein
MSNELINVESDEIEKIRLALEKATPSKKKIIIEKFIHAALGSIPWVGGFLSAAASIKTDGGQAKVDDIQRQWLEEHARKIADLKTAMIDIFTRFESIGDQINERIQSPEYLSLVRKAFRIWDDADTKEKREFIENILSNAGGYTLTSDDVIRLFLDWLHLYHEIHFAVIREISKNPGVTRYDIWVSFRSEVMREDSADADLYRLLIRDLSTGGVIRQARDTNEDGQFIKKSRKGIPRRTTSGTMESAFEDTKQYVLTELGKQFVHYTMSEIVTRIEDK